MINPDFGHEGRGSDGSEYDEPIIPNNEQNRNAEISKKGLETYLSSGEAFVACVLGAGAGTAVARHVNNNLIVPYLDEPYKFIAQGITFPVLIFAGIYGMVKLGGLIKKRIG